MSASIATRSAPTSSLRGASSKPAVARHCLAAGRARSAIVIRCQAPAAAPAAVAERTVLQVTPGKVNLVDAPDFDSLMSLATGRLVVVDVYTTWCGPCKMIAPELEKMAEEWGDKVVISKIDCTSNPDNKKWALSQSVKALPTFILFKDGKRVNDMTGAKAANLRKLIEAHM